MLQSLQLSIEHAEWLEEVRKIPSELAAGMGVVSKGENIAFEFRRNRVPSFIKVRQEILRDGESTKTFWIEPKGSALCFWNEDCLNEPSEAPLIITEGEFDALSFMAAGATHVVSVPNGAPLAKPGEGEIDPNSDKAFGYLWDGGRLRAGLEKFAKIILATDDDQKGRILRDELAVRLGRTRCWHVTYPDEVVYALGRRCKDGNEVLIHFGDEALRGMVADAKPIVPNQLVSFDEIPASAHQAIYRTGWQKLDRHLRIVPPQFIVVTGRPNAGKSQWTLALVANLARLHGMRCAIMQFEDNPERNRDDLICYASRWHKQEKSGISDTPAKWVGRMFRTISPSEEVKDSNFNLEWLDSAIEEAATRHGCRCVLIDPFNELEHQWARNHSEAHYLNEALRYLKRICRRYQIVLIVVAHPTKEGGKFKGLDDANLYDISGGAAWNNKADIGVVVWADDVKSPSRLIKVCKSKDFARMGVPGTVEMLFDPSGATFKEA